MKQINVKRLLLPNIPYVFIALFATKLGQAARLAPGADFSQKALHIMEGFAAAFQSALPSFHPIDLCVGIAAALLIRLAVYVKGKNARKFRKNIEYGSARWGSAEDIKPYVDPTFANNVILTQTERLTMNSRPKDPKTARNKNVLVVGASGLIVGNTSINLADHIADLEARLLEMNVWTLLGLWLQSFVVGFSMWALTICIFIIIYGRMIEIYLVTSIAPIPMATMMGKEWGGMGQNYLRSLLALAFQGFLIIICIAIYAVLVQNMLIDDNISTAIWLCMGYTVLLCFTLFKTSSLAKSIFNSH